MAKSSGLGDNFYFNGYDWSGDVGALQRIAAARAVLDVTAISKSAHERVLGLASGEITFSSFWDVVAGQMIEGTALPAGDIMATYARGTALGNPAAAMLGKQVNFDPDRAADGALVTAVQVLSDSAPLEWGISLTTGKQNFAGAAAGTSLDDVGLVSTAFGAVSYLQVFSVGTGTAVVAVQDSADNLAFTNITGLAHTGATGRTTERLATGTTATIRRYLRVNVTGTFTNALIHLTLVRFAAAQS